MLSRLLVIIIRKVYTLDFYSLGVKSIHLISQAAILTPFREPMPATLHFYILGFKPENFENNLKAFIKSLIDL